MLLVRKDFRVFSFPKGGSKRSLRPGKLMHNFMPMSLCFYEHYDINSTVYMGRFIMFSVITNIYNKKSKGPTLMELFTATRKLKKFFFFLATRDVLCVPPVVYTSNISSCQENMFSFPVDLTNSIKVGYLVFLL
jgi:hypothetical protein